MHKHNKYSKGRDRVKKINNRRKNQKYRDTERSLNSQKSKIEEEFESKIVVLNKKIKILENDAFQYREKIKNLDSQLTQKKIIVLSNNNQKVINNTNEPNDDNNEKNIISSLNGIFLYIYIRKTGI